MTTTDATKMTTEVHKWMDFGFPPLLELRGEKHYTKCYCIAYCNGALCIRLQVAPPQNPNKHEKTLGLLSYLYDVTEGGDMPN